VNDAKRFFDRAKYTSREIHSPLSVKRCRDFFRTASELIGEICLPRSILSDVMLEDAKQFFEHAHRTLSQPFATKTSILEESQEFFNNAKLVTQERQVDPPIETFEEFCKNAYPLILNEYHKWVGFIQEKSTGHFQRINLLKVFGISGKEDAHSKFLVWLLREEESHGLGNAFLQEFLNVISQKYNTVINLSSNGVTVIPEASGEHGVPDIKIESKDFLCIVENKIRAMEGKDQTIRYADDALREIQAKKIPEERLFLIFLTPTGQKPFDNRFKPMNYNEIIALLTNLLQWHKNISDSARFLIEQFIFNLQMEILHVFDLEQKVENCLRKYFKHGEKYLWGDYENIRSIFDELIDREGH